MKRKILINFIYQASYQVLLIALPIVTVPIVSHALQPEGVGAYNYVQSIFYYFSVFAGLGITTLGVREIAVVREDLQKKRDVFNRINSFNFWFTLFVCIIYFVISVFFESTLRRIFFIQGLSLIALAFDVSWYFQGIEDFKIITIRNFIVKLVTFFLILFFVKKPSDIYLYSLAIAVSNLVGTLSLWLGIKKEFSIQFLPFWEVIDLSKDAVGFLGNKLASTVFINITKTVLGISGSLAAVGVFSNSLTIATLVGTIVNVSNTVLIPHMSNLMGKNKKDALIKNMEIVIHLQLFITIAIAFGLLTVNNKLVPWFFGEKFDQVRFVMPLLCIVPIFSTMHQAVAFQYLVPIKKMKDFNLSMIKGMLTSIVLSFICIPSMGVYGSVLALDIAYIVLSYSRMKVLIEETTFKLRVKEICLYIFCGFIMFIVTTLITSPLKASFITTTIQVIVGSIIYLSLTALVKINPLISVLLPKIKRR